MRGAILRIVTLFWRSYYRIYLWIFRGDRVIRNLDAWALRIGMENVLRSLGATVGERTRLDPAMQIKNAENGSLHNLIVGKHVRTGPGLLIDLAEKIIIEDEAGIADGTIIVTHFTVGDRPLLKYVGNAKAPVRIGRGAYVGVGCILLHGVTVEDYAIVGAGTLVRENVPTKSIMVGVPGRVIKTFEFDPDEQDA